MSHWRWIFWINIPIGILGVILASRYHRQFPRGGAAAARPQGLRPLRHRALRPRLRFHHHRPGPVAAGDVSPRCSSIGIVGCWLYVRHARATPAPLIDLRAAQGRDLLRQRGRRLPLPHRHRRHAVSPAAPVPARLRHDAVSVRHAHLRRRRRRHRHEDDGGARSCAASASSACWSSTPFISAPSSPRRRCSRRSTPHVVILAVLLVGGFFKLAAIHLHQCAGLCRYRASAT